MEQDGKRIKQHVAIEIYKCKLRIIRRTTKFEDKFKGQISVIAHKFKVSSKCVRDIWNHLTWRNVTKHLWPEEEDTEAGSTSPHAELSDLPTVFQTCWSVGNPNDLTRKSELDHATDSEVYAKRSGLSRDIRSHQAELSTQKVSLIQGCCMVSSGSAVQTISHPSTQAMEGRTGPQSQSAECTIDDWLYLLSAETASVCPVDVWTGTPTAAICGHTMTRNEALPPSHTFRPVDSAGELSSEP